MPSGSSAAIWAGVMPNHPGVTGKSLLKPRTVSPGQTVVFAQRYIRTPSRNEADGTLRRTGVSLFSFRPSKLPKKNNRFFFAGPPRAPPNVSLSSLGARFGLPDE